MTKAVKQTRLIYRIAGIYGLVVLLPLFVLEGWIGRLDPPAVTHPEYYYGFASAAGTMQFLYLLISTDPVRYRPAMPVAVLGKLSFAIAVAVLLAQGRVSAQAFGMSMIDLGIGAMFLLSYRRLRPQA